MALTNALNKIRKATTFDVTAEVMKIINLNESFMVFLLKQQLQAGIDGNGKGVTVFGRSEYRQVTIEAKEYEGIGLGAVTDRITNYMFGNFYDSLYVQTEGTVFTYKSDLDYAVDIRKQSGDIIFKLNAASLARLKKEIIIPQLQERYKQQMNGF